MTPDLLKTMEGLLERAEALHASLQSLISMTRRVEAKLDTVLQRTV